MLGSLSRIFRQVAVVGAFVLCLPGPALAETLTGRCVSVHDGDTVTVQTARGREKVRLLGIDTPELAQAPWGERARLFTDRLVRGQEVRVETDVQPRDRYGRLLGYVYVGETFVNLEVIRSGQAVLLTYPPNVRHVEAFTAAQTEARTKGVGVWDPKEPLTVSPKAFRHGGGRRAGQAKPEGRAPESPAPSLAPGATVRFNPRSHKFHPEGCGHPCGSCEPLTVEEAKARGGVACKHR
ncbi:MAG: thermonuclease family protein [Candidatus Sericytochromatia bacterium]|nr:thermonuclease family protein [Candidatus Sericytochromatia bacterium]